MTDQNIARDQWIANALAVRGETIAEIETVRANPETYVLLVRTNIRQYYFKWCPESFAYEPRVSAALARWFPTRVPEIIAVDDERRWLLVADAGQTVKALIALDNDFTRWDELLRQFAALQRDAIPHARQLLEIGVPDRRLVQLPALYNDLIADREMLMIGLQDGISENDHARLVTFAPEVNYLCDEAAQVMIPPTLHHDDFHVSNVGFSSNHYQVFDWGECAIAHPFYSLFMSLRYAKLVYKLDNTKLDHLRDVYLECWTDYAPLHQLRTVVSLTNRLGALCRTCTWRAFVQTTEGQFRAENADTVPYWLMTFLNNTPLSS